jgi:hypothetical protein
MLAHHHATRRIVKILLEMRAIMTKNGIDVAALFEAELRKRG